MTAAGSHEMGPLARRFLRSVDQYRDREAQALGLDHSGLLCLGHLLNDGAMTPSGIAEQLGLTSASVTALLDRLSAAGLIRRRPHPDDRRSVLVSLTAAGTRLIRRVYVGMADAVTEARDALPAEHRCSVETFLVLATDAMRSRTRAT